MRFGASHRHGDCRHGGGSDGARADCSRACAGNPDVATDPKPSPDLAVALALPGRCLQVGFDGSAWSEIAGFGPRRFAGGGSACWPEWRRTRSGPCPRRRRPAAGRRPDPCRARWRRRDLRRPKGPKVSVLASSSSTCMVNSPIRFMALSSSACTGSPLRCLTRRRSRRSLSHATARAGRSLRPTGATEVAPARAGTTSRCAPPSKRKPGLGKTWIRCQGSPAFTRPITNFLKIIGHDPVPPWTFANSVSIGPTQKYFAKTH